MTRIDVEYVKKIQAERKRINDLELKDIEWYENGKKLDIDPEVLEEFKFTGLCNTDFIISDVYKGKGTKMWTILKG